VGYREVAHFPKIFSGDGLADGVPVAWNTERRSTAKLNGM
jgi:hypothetical protein